jgi:hypothetical protein
MLKCKRAFACRCRSLTLMLCMSLHCSIEDVLAYLQEFRFGRQTSATAHIQQLQKSAPELQADVRSLESEWATWLLLIELRRADETASDAPVEPSTAERYSNQILASRVVGEPAGPLGRILRILNWLEEQHVHLLRIEETGSVSLRSTLRKLQRSSSGDAQRDFLDPDVELRLKANGVIPKNGNVLEQQDVAEEQRLLEYVWQLIRAGRLTEAIHLCRTYQQHWRAASLQGGERIHDDGTLGEDGSAFRVGNPTYLLWRYTCRRLASAAGVGPVEASIYGLLGGDLQQAVRCAGQYKYDDALYCYLKVLVDEQVDDFIRAEGKADALTERLPRIERAQPLETTLAGVLGSLESPLNPLLTPTVSSSATSNAYIRLRKYLMLGDRERAEEEMANTIRQWYQGPMAPPPAQQQESGVNHTYLLFAVHVYLYLHPRCPHAEPLNEVGTYLVQSYLAYLEAHPSQHSLIASYAQYLSSPARCGFYIRFLRRIPSLEARKRLLGELEKWNGENVLEVTTGLVQNIIGEETQERQMIGGGQVQGLLMPGAAISGSLTTPSTAAGGVGGVTNLLQSGTGITQSDLEKISSIDCFTLSGPSVTLEVVQEALIQATQLYRSFISKGRYAPAKRFAQHLQEKMWEHSIFQTMQRQEQKREPRQCSTAGRFPGFACLWCRCSCSLFLSVQSLSSGSRSIVSTVTGVSTSSVSTGTTRGSRTTRLAQSHRCSIRLCTPRSSRRRRSMRSSR